MSIKDKTFGVFTGKMITKIKKIKTFGVFDNYQASADLPDFKKYNLIYSMDKTMNKKLKQTLLLDSQNRNFIINKNIEEK